MQLLNARCTIKQNSGLSGRGNGGRKTFFEKKVLHSKKLQKGDGINSGLSVGSRLLYRSTL